LHGKQEVFNRLGLNFDLQFNPLGKSSTLYNKYFTSGHVEHLGTVNKMSFYKRKERINESFLSFCKERNVPIPTEYRKNNITLESCIRSISKYDKEPPSVNLRYWQYALDCLDKHFRPYMCNSRVSSHELAMSELNKQSSGGWPASLKFPSKESALSAGYDKYLDEYYQHIAHFPLDDDAYVPIWTCSGKSELREISKIEMFGGLYDKVRTFTASPMEHTYASLRLYYDMNNKMYDSHLKTWSFVGGSKFNLGWDQLFHHLSSLNSTGWEFDAGDYDASLFEFALQAIADFRWSLFHPDDKDVDTKNRHMHLYRHIIHSLIVLDTGDLIRKHGGNPSGSQNTITDNTLVLFLLLCYAFAELYEKEFGELPTYEFLIQSVVAILNGDDNNLFAKESIKTWFNAPAICECWTKLNITTKTPTLVPRRPEEMEFLSHSFVKIPSAGEIWLPKPDGKKVLSSLMYGSAIQDIRWHMLRAFALRVESWPDIETRRIIQEYIDWSYDHFRDKLIGEVWLNPTDPKSQRFSWAQIYKSWKTDTEILDLYIGREGNSSKSPHPINLDILSYI
jgi:hypothetical protein